MPNDLLTDFAALTKAHLATLEDAPACPRCSQPAGKLKRWATRWGAQSVCGFCYDELHFEE